MLRDLSYTPLTPRLRIPVGLPLGKSVLTFFRGDNHSFNLKSLAIDCLAFIYQKWTEMNVSFLLSQFLLTKKIDVAYVSKIPCGMNWMDGEQRVDNSGHGVWLHDSRWLSSP